MNRVESQPARSVKIMLLDRLAVVLGVGLILFAFTDVVGEVFGSTSCCGRPLDINRSNIMAATGALEDYALEHCGTYPDSLNALNELNNEGTPYLRWKPPYKDPWGREYIYLPPGPGTEPYPTVYTLGRDGSPGGSGDDKDLSTATYLGEPWSAPTQTCGLESMEVTR
jgi:hypothetical protein